MRHWALALWLLFELLLLRGIKSQEVEAPVLAGYDLVAYHSLNVHDEGVLGNPSVWARYDSYIYHFSSEENRRQFLRDPERYLPAFGGFGAWGLAYEFAEDGWPWTRRHLGPSCDPRHGWFVYQSVLYCNLSAGRKWDAVATLNITLERAERRWAQFYGIDQFEAIRPMNNGCYLWNWQSCFEKSLPIPGIDQNRSELILFEDEAKSSVQTISLTENISFTWTMGNISSIDPTLVVLLNTTLDADSEYIAFGLAEILMEGILIVCSPAFRAANANADCRTYVGEGMHIKKASEEESNLQLRSASYDPETGEYTVHMSCSLYKMRGTPRLLARVIFAKGQVVNDVPRGHTIADRWEIERVNLLSVVDQVLSPVIPPRPALARSLPLETLWNSLGKGSVKVLENRVKVAYEFFRVGGEILIRSTLETDAAPDTYVAFGISPEFMSGYIVTCTVEDCQQWRGEDNNLRPLDMYMDPGGWMCTSIGYKDDGITIAFTIIAYLSDLVVLPEGFDVETLRAISAIGNATDDGTPLQHAPRDATSFLLDTEEQSSGFLSHFFAMQLFGALCFVSSTAIL